MTCREFSDFIVDHVSGELSLDVRQEFETHLSRCMNCQKYLAAYTQTIELGRRAFEDDEAEVPAEVPEDLVKAIMAARRR